MTHELGPNQNPEREAQLETFKTLIEIAVKPVMDMREGGRIPIYGGGKIADTGMTIGSGSIGFEKFKDEHSEIVTAGGLGGIKDVTHAARITEVHEFFGSRLKAAVFGLTKQGELKRMIAFGDDRIFPPNVSRDFGMDETEALIQFLTSPHLNLDKLGVIMRLTDEEQVSLDRQEQKRAKFEDKLRHEKEDREKRRQKQARRLGRRGIFPHSTDH